MYKKEIEYGKELLDKKSFLPEKVLKEIKVVKRFVNTYGNPTYSFYYNGKKAILIDYYGNISTLRNIQDVKYKDL